jgi:hypothetical protein
LKNENKPGETFVQALEDILRSPERAEKVVSISVLRAEEEARGTIFFPKKEIGFGATEDDIFDYHRYCAQFYISLPFGALAEELK